MRHRTPSRAVAGAGMRPGPGEVLASFVGPYGLYLHVPFCRSICPYCPYNKVLYRAAAVPRYFAALHEELRMYDAPRRRFASLYVGGGHAVALPGRARHRAGGPDGRAGTRDRGAAEPRHARDSRRAPRARLRLREPRHPVVRHEDAPSPRPAQHRRGQPVCPRGDRRQLRLRQRRPHLRRRLRRARRLPARSRDLLSLGRRPDLDLPTDALRLHAVRQGGPRCGTRARAAAASVRARRQPGLRASRGVDVHAPGRAAVRVDRPRALPGLRRRCGHVHRDGLPREPLRARPLRGGDRRATGSRSLAGRISVPGGRRCTTPSGSSTRRASTSTASSGSSPVHRG